MSRNEVLWIRDFEGRPLARLVDHHSREGWSDDRHGDECGFSGKDFDLPLSTALRNALESFPSIAMDSDVVGGAPRVAGTRIPVYMILDAVEYYGSIRDVLKSYSQLTVEQVKDAVSFAGAVLEQSVDYESSASPR